MLRKKKINVYMGWNKLDFTAGPIKHAIENIYIERELIRFSSYKNSQEFS